MVKTKLKPGVPDVCLQLANELQNILVNQKRRKRPAGDCFSSFAVLYRVPKNSISQFIPHVCDAIYEVLQDFIKVPEAEQEWRSIQRESYTHWNFPNCLGAIDGKHVIIRCPPKTGSEYFNYKHSFSITLMAIVDANYCFSYIDLGTNGRISDARVFSKSAFYEAMEHNILHLPSNGVFVADDAFPLRTNLLKPYSRSEPLTECQQMFNYRLSRARQIVENAFCMLTSRFRIFEKLIPLATSTIIKVINSTCVLHNWLRNTTDHYITAENVNTKDITVGRVTKGSWRDAQIHGIAPLSNTYSSNNHSHAAKAVRDAYAERFSTTEAVSWQLKTTHEKNIIFVTTNNKLQYRMVHLFVALLRTINE
nr:unnamed protein product [Callosobruchus analis]